MLTPATVYAQLTSAELALLQSIADRMYADGQLIIGNGQTGGVSVNTLTAGPGIAIANGHGTITISSAPGSGLNPQTPTGTVNSSNVTFTASGKISVAFADSLLDSSAALSFNSGTNQTTITYSVPPQNNVYVF